MTARVRVEVSATTWHLSELERLCAVARERGLSDEASVSVTGSPMTIRIADYDEQVDQ